jgi:antitoxin (DNA-binding transcriptional repressor) of toxin-antitoxin stability system
VQKRLWGGLRYLLTERSAPPRRSARHPSSSEEGSGADRKTGGPRYLLPKLIEVASRGEEVIITRGSNPVVRFVALQQAGRRRPGALRGKLDVGPEFFDPIPMEESEGGDKRRHAEE